MLEDIINYNKEINSNEKYMFDFEEINPDYQIFINTFENEILLIVRLLRKKQLFFAYLKIHKLK